MEDERGALGEATGHEEPSAGDCGEFCGGNGEVEVALCMGHPGLSCQLSFRKLFQYSLHEERHLSWVEDEARAASGALRCLPKTTPCRTVL